MFVRSLRRVAARLALPFALGAASLPVYTIPDFVTSDPTTVSGTPFDVKPGDEVLTGRILRAERLFLDDPVSATVDRFTDTFAAGGELTPVIAPDKTTAAMGSNGVYYCGRDLRARSALADSLWGSFGSKFESIVRLCFIDTDHDGKLDQVFLAGAKDKTLQVPKPISPVRFHTAKFDQADPGDKVVIRYKKFSPESGKAEFVVEVQHAGKADEFDYINWKGSPTAPMTRLQPRLVSNPRKTPYPASFDGVLGAEIRINRMAPDGTLNVQVARDFGLAMFRPVSIKYTYIFIYY